MRDVYKILFMMAVAMSTNLRSHLSEGGAWFMHRRFPLKADPNPPTCKYEGVFLYSAMLSHLDRSKRFTHFIPWQTCPFRHQRGFSGKHSSHAAITRNDCTLTFPPLSIATSLIQHIQARSD